MKHKTGLRPISRLQSRTGFLLQNSLMTGDWVLYTLIAFGCCAPQTLVKIFIFGIFCAKNMNKRKKVTNLVQNLAKKNFKFAPKRWLSVLLPDLTYLKERAT